ncbi:MAG: hypothetical protein R3F56_05520 [Planctomycetota bacterium]
MFLALASLASLAVLLVGIAWPALSPHPRMIWRVGSDLHEARQETEVTSGTPVALEVDLPFPAHVYVASWSTAMGTIALFPSEHLATARANPLPAGKHHLPGLHEDTPTTWPTPNVVGPVYYLALVSCEPRPQIEAALRRVRQMGHLGQPGTGIEDRGMYVFVPEAGLDEAVPPDVPVAPEFDAARTVLGELAGQEGSGAARELPGEAGVYARPFVVIGH